MERRKHIICGMAHFGKCRQVILIPWFIIEPPGRGNKKAFEVLLSQYYSCISQVEGLRELPEEGKNGALMFAVCWIICMFHCHYAKTSMLFARSIEEKWVKESTLQTTIVVPSLHLGFLFQTSKCTRWQAITSMVLMHFILAKIFR